MGNIRFGIFRKDLSHKNAIKIGMVSHFQPKNSQIVAFFEKKIWGALKNQEKPSKKAFSSKYIEKSLGNIRFGIFGKDYQIKIQ